MRAFVLNHYGGPGGMGFREVAEPRPSAGELLVQVHSAGLNPVDYKFRQGKLWPIYHPKLPIIMGNELAGTVIACGSEASRFAIGDRIFVRGHKAQLGAFAELACVPATLASKIPTSIAFDAAGGVPLAALTALEALRDELRVQPGLRILITGATGGVGTFAVQLAKLMGAEVYATASPAGRSLAISLGADRVINYEHDRIEDVARNVDGVFDLVGGRTLVKSFRTVRRGGIVVSIAGVPEPTTARRDLGRGWALATLFWFLSFRLRSLARRQNVKYRYFFMHGSGPDLDEIAKLIDEQKLQVVVDSTFPFAQIHEAFARLEQGHAKGKIIVIMGAINRPTEIASYRP